MGNHLITKAYVVVCLGLVLGMGLSACGGESSEDLSPKVVPQVTDSVTKDGSSSQVMAVDQGKSRLRTTLGTRGFLAKDNPVRTDVSNQKWIEYKRPIDYPKVAQQPLQYITLKSGKRIGVIVGLPADQQGKPVAGKFPVLLTQTAYNIEFANTLNKLTSLMTSDGSSLLIGGLDPYFVKRGYVTVSADVLGLGVSEGGWEFMGKEEQESYGQVLDWVVAQPWSDGKVGLVGTSYLGITSLFTAAQESANQNAIKAVFVDVPMGDSYRGAVGIGGQMNALFMGWWISITQLVTDLTNSTAANYPQYRTLIQNATKEHRAQIRNYYLPTVEKGLAGDAEIANDGGFWQSRSPIEQVHKIKAPTIIVGGNADLFQRDVPLLYEQMKQQVPTKLVVLDGTHVQVAARLLVGTKGLGTGLEIMLRWFDQYVKGMDVQADKIPNVTQYVTGFQSNIGNGAYAISQDWPHPQATAERWYLHGSKTLNKTAPESNEPVRVMDEPPAPKVTVGTLDNDSLVSFNITLPDGSACSQSYAQWTLGISSYTLSPCYSDSSQVTKNALRYETALMTEPYYFNGPIQADIWISSTKTEAAVAVRIDDVSPNGVATPLSTGIQAASMRKIDDSRSRYLNNIMIQPWHPFTEESMLPVTPNEPMPVSVEVFPTAALIKPGHRLRVSISPSNQAMGIWNHKQQIKAANGVTTVYHDAKYPSSIVLPKVPYTTLQ